MIDRNKKYIKLFASCLPVKGASRSIICDLQTNTIEYIPNSLFDLLGKFDSLCVGDLLNFYGVQHAGIVSEYLDFLLDHEFAFYCSKTELNHFPSINLDYQSAGILQNAIVELSAFDETSFLKIADQLSKLQCRAIEIRIFEKNSVDSLGRIISILDATYISDIHLKFVDDDFSFDCLAFLFEKSIKLRTLIAGSSKQNKNYSGFAGPFSQIVFTVTKVHLATNCGCFEKYSFITNIDFFTESQKYNTCLNKKVSIDIQGNVKNCPSMTHSFGNINDTTILDILDKTELKAKWQINKDVIEVCKYCEFRYICMDCRAYLDNPSNDHSKPLKCGYNPYTGEWDDWTSNPLKKKAINHYKIGV